MGAKERIEDDLKAALLARDEPRKRTLRNALAALRLAEVEKGTALDEASALAVIQKEIKACRESQEDARRANRPDLADTAQAEIAVLEEFLPAPLSPAELEALARQAVAEAGVTSLREMGQAMKLLVPRLQGRATGEQASQAVRKILSG